MNRQSKGQAAFNNIITQNPHFGLQALHITLLWEENKSVSHQMLPICRSICYRCQPLAHPHHHKEESTEGVSVQHRVVWLPRLTILQVSGWVWTAACCNFGIVALGTCWKGQQQLFGVGGLPHHLTTQGKLAFLFWRSEVTTQTYLFLRLFVHLNCSGFYKSCVRSTKQN